MLPGAGADPIWSELEPTKKVATTQRWFKIPVPISVQTIEHNFKGPDSCLAVYCFAAHLLAWGALLATLLVAGVALTVAGALALNVAGEALGALDLLLLGPAAAGLDDHLEAGGTVPAVTSASNTQKS